MTKYQTESEKQMVRSTVQLASGGVRPLHKKGSCKRPCPGCPYLKNKKNWLTEAGSLLNVTLVHLEEAQYCHMAVGRMYECAGARICIAGGSDTIVTPAELGTRPPVTPQESRANYMENLGKTK
jgi:hypothetical protein